MASSSSSAASSSSAPSSQPPKKYDVFISFRGEDVRETFVGHLHVALCGKQIETYIDYRLREGYEIWSSLVQAIKDSILFLVIFSKDYASSTWCLDELTEILECCKDPGNLVIPVFYNIEPTHIRKQTGSYQEAFAEHERNHDHQKVLKWKAALTQAANLKGWDSGRYRNEAQLIIEIVRCVRKKLEPIYQNVSFDGRGLVGIQPQIERLESLLCIESGVKMFIGIWGMGGIGKTIIAEALFKKWCFKFESFCFLSNVREESQRYGITQLSRRLTSILNDEIPHMGMPDAVSINARERLRRKKVLVVLDDVNDADQLKNLANRCWFGEGSKVIITTRDQQVLLCNRNIDHIYRVRELGDDNALKLFKLNALKHDCLEEDFRELCWEVLDYAKGIPFVLEELGSILYSQRNEPRKTQLENLRKGHSKRIQQKLQVSYEGLSDKEKTIFLDVACFFIGRAVEKIEYLLDACGYENVYHHLISLRDKTLLTISEDYVSMHKLIQQMGWEVVREECYEDPGKRSRLWDSIDICPLLESNEGSESIRGISQNVSEKSETEELKLHPQAFAKMDNLKFLQIYNSKEIICRVIVRQGILEHLSRKLRYLRWVECPLRSLPLTFSAEYLVELDMQCSKMEKLWDGVQKLKKLKMINLSDSRLLMKLPDFSDASNLKMVILSRCSSLLEVHPSILSLDKLEVLNLNACTSLPSLPELPPSLRLLDATDCSSLQKVTVTSIAAEPLKANMKEANFRNCLELDDHSVKAILANVMIHINKSVSEFQNSSYKTEVIYPGSIVPEWFKYKTTDATSVTVDLSSAPLSKDWGLLFCVIVPQSISNDEGICIEYEGYMRIISDQGVDKGNDDDEGELGPAKLTSDYWKNPRRDLKNLISDHVCLWYDERFCLAIHERLQESRATSIPNISLELNFRCDFLERRRWRRKEIKKCGVCPTYVPEYQDFIRQMESNSQATYVPEYQNFIRQMESNSQASVSGIRYRLISPSQIAPRENRTQGLKYIIDP